MIVVIIVIAVILLLILWFKWTYDSLHRDSEEAEVTYRAMYALLRQRCDLAAELVKDMQKETSSYGKLIEHIIAEKNLMITARSSGEVILHDRVLEKLLDELEETLKKNEIEIINPVSRKLAQLRILEESIAAAKIRYNEATEIYNRRAEHFPSILVAGISGFHPKPLYEF